MYLRSFQFPLRIGWIAATACLAFASIASATTIDATNRYAYAANLGWVDAGDTTNGLVVGQTYCSGYLYAANVGWINCGEDIPKNGANYSNASDSDFGINHDGQGRLSGMAYGANIGWIVFEQTYGKPVLSLETGNFSGYAWSANCGWINLAGITTTVVLPGPDEDADGIPDAWEYQYTSDIELLDPSGDPDGDGTNNLAEYEGNTNPFDANDNTRIIQILSETAGADLIIWTCNSGRMYSLITAEGLDVDAKWIPVLDSFIPESGPAVKFEVAEPLGDKRFYRVVTEVPMLP